MKIIKRWSRWIPAVMALIAMMCLSGCAALECAGSALNQTSSDVGALNGRYAR